MSSRPTVLRTPRSARAAHWAAFLFLLSYPRFLLRYFVSLLCGATGAGRILGALCFQLLDITTREESVAEPGAHAGQTALVVELADLINREIEDLGGVRRIQQVVRLAGGHGYPVIRPGSWQGDSRRSAVCVNKNRRALAAGARAAPGR